MIKKIMGDPSIIENTNKDGITFTQWRYFSPKKSLYVESFKVGRIFCNFSMKNTRRTKTKQGLA